MASPSTKLDVKLEGSDQIENEEWFAGEMIESSGAPKDMRCLNPAFDVTMAEYSTGIITEKGVLKKLADEEVG